MSAGNQAKFYKTAAWVNCRKAYLAKVGGLCERCLAKGLIVPAEIIHHKIRLNENNITDPSVTLNFEIWKRCAVYAMEKSTDARSGTQ